MANPDPTVTVVLTRDEIKTLCKSSLIKSIKESLHEDILDEDIETIYKYERVPDYISIDDETKQKIEKDISDILRKADEEFKDALANLPRFQYWVVTMNMNGTTAAGVTQHRRDLITIILKNNVSGVVFCQELPGHFKRDIITVLNRDNQQFDYQRTVNEAGIVWNTNKFVGVKENFKATDTRMTSIRDQLAADGGQVQDMLSRACFVKLTSIADSPDSPQRSFIAVSYHGKLKTGIGNRINTFQSLIRFLDRLCEEEGDIPFLIGGDFNFDTLEDYCLPENVVCGRYEMTSRANSPTKIPYKDNFFWKPIQLITITSLRPFVFGIGEDCDLSIDESNDAEQHPDADNHEEQVYDLLDHDPIIGILELLEDHDQHQI